MERLTPTQYALLEHLAATAQRQKAEARQTKKKFKGGWTYFRARVARASWFMFLAALIDLEAACECPHCGRVVFCGPPCCDLRAKEAEDFRLREQGLHPDQIAERRKAKRDRRLARRAARRDVP